MTDNIYHLAELFFWMLGAFIIGLVFGKFTTKKKNEKSIANDEFFEEIIEEDFSKIRATQTFGRGGREMTTGKKSGEISLQFDKFGGGSAGEKDDLQKIKGIGSVTESKLNKLGLFNYSQLSALNNTDMKIIAESIQFPLQRILKDDWVGQAKVLSK